MPSVSSIDEIAWFLNIRGTDVPCNPVGICFSYISEKERILFVNAQKINKDTAEYLQENDIKIAQYEKIYDFLKNPFRIGNYIY